MPTPIYIVLWVIAALVIAAEYRRASDFDRFPDE